MCKEQLLLALQLTYIVLNTFFQNVWFPQKCSDAFKLSKLPRATLQLTYIDFIPLRAFQHISSDIMKVTLVFPSFKEFIYSLQRSIFVETSEKRRFWFASYLYCPHTFLQNARFSQKFLKVLNWMCLSRATSKLTHVDLKLPRIF